MNNKSRSALCLPKHVDTGDGDTIGIPPYDPAAEEMEELSRQVGSGPVAADHIADALPGGKK